MSTITTYTGIHFDPICPDAALIRIEDIAHALSMLCRAGGHFPTFYSVAQHSLNCAAEAAARGLSRKIQLGCLLHDGSEAYLSDITRPVKAELPRYREIEKPLQDMIWKKWLDAPLTAEEEALVFGIDNDLLVCEFQALMNIEPPAAPELASRPAFSFTGFDRCEEDFLRLFRLLTGNA